MAPGALDQGPDREMPIMRRACVLALIAPLILTACGDGGDPPPQRPAEPPAAPAPAPVGPTPDQVRADILSTLAAHPAGLETESAAGRRILSGFGPADCRPGAEAGEAPFERICASPADAGSGIALIIHSGLILAAVVRGLPEGVEGWDCQPAEAPPDHTICMATRVSSAQSGAWSGYWNARAGA